MAVFGEIVNYDEKNKKWTLTQISNYYVPLYVCTLEQNILFLKWFHINSKFEHF